MEPTTEPTDEEIESECRKILKEVDLETTGTKKVVKILSKAFGDVDLSSRKPFIKETLVRILNEDDGVTSQDEHDDHDDESLPTPKRQGGGLTQKKEISEALANLLGKGKEMSRTEIVKELNDYIKRHDLQNPENRRGK